MIIKDPKKIDEILERADLKGNKIFTDFYPSKDEFRRKLLSGKKLRFYIGFDATAPTLHLGHARNFLLMEKFRQLGHEVIILFGDFTARIGDPDKEAARKQLSKKEVNFNVSKWKKLIKPLMDFKNKENPVQIRHNSQWLSKLKFEDIINLASNFTVQQMLERDMFHKRTATWTVCRHCKNKFISPIQFSEESFKTANLSGNTINCPNCGKQTGLDKDDLIFGQEPVYLHEFLYPLMQGYDSVAMDVDVEVCGTDQIFNALAGRTLLKRLKNKEKFVVAASLIENPVTGEMMSKSKGTGVFLDQSAEDMFGSIMAQPDEMIEVLFVNLTDFSLEKIREMNISQNPFEAKKILAFEITKIFHGEKKSQKARENWEIKFSKREISGGLEIAKIKFENQPLFKVLLQISPKNIKSNSSAKKLIEQGGVDVDEKQIKDPYFVLEKNKEYILKIGKKDFKKVVFK